MCGNGCNCWMFVCKNCCYNQYCQDHDNYCAAKASYASQYLCCLG